MKKASISIVMGLFALVAFCTATPSEATLGISNVVATFNPVTCKLDVTWDTAAKSSSKVFWGTSCASLTSNATGSDCVTSHTVSFSVPGFNVNDRIYFKVESATNCETDESSCTFKVRDPCIDD